MFGVSPAFVFSLFGTAFRLQDYCAALPRLQRLGFGAYQPEIYRADALAEWERGAGELHGVASDLGLVPSQLVAHFLLERFKGPGAIEPGRGCDEIRRLAEIAKRFPPCQVITIPAPAFQADWGSPAGSSAAGWRDLQGRLQEQIRSYLTILTDAGLKLAFEIMPFSVLGGLRRFLATCDEIGSPDLGLNLDTGHAWASGELVPALPFEWAGRIFGTHLGDNLGTDNVKLPLGQGSVPWEALLRNLGAAGYAGSLDIEVACPADEVELRYRESLLYLQSLARTPQGDPA